MRVYVTLEPDNVQKTVTKVRSVQGVLNRLGFRYTEVLVIRDGGLLTQDLPVNDGDELIVRTVISRG